MMGLLDEVSNPMLVGESIDGEESLMTLSFEKCQNPNAKNKENLLLLYHIPPIRLAFFLNFCWEF